MRPDDFNVPSIKTAIQSNTDNVFNKLVEESEFWDEATKQVLELIFGAFVVKTKVMLADHQKGGRYDEASQNIRKQSSGVLETNVVPERDFGMLDRLIATKPNATTMVYEGMITFTKNDTRGWRENLDPVKKKKIMTLARESKEDHRKQHKQRQAEIRKVRERKMATAQEEKQKQKIKNRIEEQLCEKLEYGGLWKTKEEVQEK